MTDRQSGSSPAFLFSDADYEKVSRFASDNYGIKLNLAKKDLMYARIARQMRSLGVNNFCEYFSKVSRNGSSREDTIFLSLLTTNVTSFYREPHHFAMLEDYLSGVVRGSSCKETIRIWSAGCSSGQEAYSISATINRLGLDLKGIQIEVYATDVDQIILDKARKGLYSPDEVAGLDKRHEMDIFGSTGSSNTSLGVLPEVRERVRFSRLNLIDPWLFRTKFDVIFCRNVVIYFERKTQQALWQKFSDHLASRGMLFLGHSERISEEFDGQFENIGVTAYQRKL